MIPTPQGRRGGPAAKTPAGSGATAGAAVEAARDSPPMDARRAGSAVKAQGRGDRSGPSPPRAASLEGEARRERPPKPRQPGHPAALQQPGHAAAPPPPRPRRKWHLGLQDAKQLGGSSASRTALGSDVGGSERGPGPLALAVQVQSVGCALASSTRGPRAAPVASGSQSPASRAVGTGLCLPRGLASWPSTERLGVALL